MAVLLTNNAITKLASSVTTGATSIALTAGTGALFPSPSGGNWFPVTVIKSDGSLEIMRCTARSTDTLTVTRAQEGTTAKAFSAGDRVELRLTVAALAEFQPLAANLTAMAGLAGAADKLPYFTGSGALSLAALTTAARTLLAATDQAGQQTAMGLGTAATRAVGTASGQLIENGAGATHPWMELRSPGGTPFIDFSNDNAVDYDVRLILLGDDLLNVDGAGVNGFQIGGYKAFNAGNVLGTVGQSAGVPTGALIETGSNANGRYVRYADGTQICWANVILSTYVSTNLMKGDWTFPVAFDITNSPVIVNHSTDLSYFFNQGLSITNPTGATFEGAGATSVTLHQVALSGTYTSGKSTKQAAIAVGRWFA